MTTEVLVLGFIAITEAVALGWLISDKFGLIKDTKINDNPDKDKGDTDSPKVPSGEVKQSEGDKNSYNENDHSTTHNISKSFKGFVLGSHIIRIIKNKLGGSNLD